MSTSKNNTRKRKGHNVWQSKHSTISKILCFVMIHCSQSYAGSNSKCMVPPNFLIGGLCPGSATYTSIVWSTCHNYIKHDGQLWHENELWWVDCLTGWLVAISLYITDHSISPQIMAQQIHFAGRQVGRSKFYLTGDKSSLKGAWSGHMNHLNFGGHQRYFWNSWSYSCQILYAGSLYQVPA